jgi:4a-hydroxytetrahydrobiopterin dehydratase
MEKINYIKCVPYTKSTLKITKPEINRFLSDTSGWTLIIPPESPFLKSQEGIFKKYLFPNYELAIEFANEIANLANKQNHHPTLIIDWGAVIIFWTTHAVHGLHINDISMARNSDLLFAGFQQRKNQNES